MHKVLAMTIVSLGAAMMLSGSAAAQTNEAAQPAAVAATPKIHEVASGESLSLIAEAEKLESWRPLWNANPEITDPDLIYAGQKLTVPEGPTTDRPLPANMTVQPAAPVAKPTGSYQRRSAAPANHAAGVGGILGNIRMRESGGNYATNTGNGYYGAYQFNLSTWRGVGGSGLPSEASPAEQDMRAQMLYERRGCSPWPNTCY